MLFVFFLMIEVYYLKIESINQIKNQINNQINTIKFFFYFVPLFLKISNKKNLTIILN